MHTAPSRMSTHTFLPLPRFVLSTLSISTALLGFSLIYAGHMNQVLSCERDTVSHYTGDTGVSQDQVKPPEQSLLLPLEGPHCLLLLDYPCEHGDKLKFPWTSVPTSSFLFFIFLSFLSHPPTCQFPEYL